MGQLASAGQRWQQYKRSTAYFYSVVLGDGNVFTGTFSADNTALGSGTLASVTTGVDNTAVGVSALAALTVGNVFASPPPDPIIECAKAVDGGAGVLFMYGNYAGDVMNFDMAAEMLARRSASVYALSAVATARPPTASRVRAVCIP